MNVSIVQLVCSKLSPLLHVLYFRCYLPCINNILCDLPCTYSILSVYEICASLTAAAGHGLPFFWIINEMRSSASTKERFDVFLNSSESIEIFTCKSYFDFRKFHVGEMNSSVTVTNNTLYCMPLQSIIMVTTTDSATAFETWTYITTHDMRLVASCLPN